MTTSNLIAIRDGEINGGFYSPAKEKAAIRGPFQHRFVIFGRLRYIAKLKLLLLVFCVLCSVGLLISRMPSSFGWNLHYPSSSFSSSRGGYTVLINTWKRNSLLKQSVVHYASCHGTKGIHVVWSENDPPSNSLKNYLYNIVMAKSQTAQKPDFKFDINEEDNLNNRFKPIQSLRTDAIFSVDDDVIVPCDELDFAFSIWQTAPSTMVGFVPRMHWIGEKKETHVSYKYGGWWSVWWMGTYSMVLSKAAFFHQKYLDMYTNQMPASIRNYVTRERKIFRSKHYLPNIQFFRTSAATADVKETGLYNFPHLKTPNGFQRFVDDATERSGELIYYISSMPSSTEIIRAMDEISDTVCSVVDSARHTHPDREFVEQANIASLRMDEYLHYALTLYVVPRTSASE